MRHEGFFYYTPLVYNVLMQALEAVERTWPGVILVAVLGLIYLGARALVKRWAEAGVEARFNKKLEEFRHELNLEAEQVRFDYRRSLDNFNLFVARRHDRYAELFERILKADGRIRGLRGLRRSLTFEEYDGSDLEEYMFEREIPSGKRTEVLEEFARDRKRGIEVLEEYERAMEPGRARREWSLARNFLLANELYLSDSVREQADDVLSVLDDYLEAVQIQREYPEARGEIELPDKGAIRDAIEELRNLMRRELAEGDFLRGTAEE